MTWTCPVCTLINGPSSTCDACGAPSPQAAAPTLTPRQAPSFLPLISTCRTCNKSIWPDTSYTQALGNTYHTSCFRCAACLQDLPSGIPFNVHENEPYHPQCFQQLFHPRCDVCEELLPMNSDRRIAYQEMPYWKLKYCPLHEQRDRCCSCKRLEPTSRARHFHALSDGRKLCGDCTNTVILDNDEVQPVVEDVWAFLASLGMHLPELPVFLVDFDTLNTHSHAAHSNLPRDAKTPVVYGVCISEVTQFNHFVHRTMQQLFRLEKAPTRGVNGIMVLHGLPYDMTAYILAHEATHAYFKLHEGFPTSLPPKVEEGMCQLMGYLYLQYRNIMLPPDDAAKFPGQLRGWYLQSLIEDTSPVYGDGLREALHAYNRYNSLQLVLDHIRQTSAFPA
ncbi:Aste57867_15999 [Aphanomyces stellatus]|uniref:Aste57867_15999 protein n=1 Tax=Aphanomyces stellatus TaxID=120398 RepID=A0A485L4R4_9STRA|nr:hypothetical protein As57867_015943 [Aphanomyces stellatus]VFT92784.1 Aste57867_15999 [Aphanomyces stellatus]